MPWGSDGVDFINVYSKAETRLGRFLSNFSYAPFVCEDGLFESVEGYWYWLTRKDDRLRTLSGYAAKKLGKSLPKVCEDALFQSKIQNAVTCKLKNNPTMLRLLKRNKLPLAHYYVYNGKRVAGGYEWILEHIALCAHKLG